MTKVAFITYFTERGTGVATYDYAHYNETILGNTSIIISLHHNSSQQEIFDRFNERFLVYEVAQFSEIDALLKLLNIDVCYKLSDGRAPVPPYGGYITATKFVVHCVFTCRHKYGDVYIPISDQINLRDGTSYPVLPHMISIADTQEDMRAVLNIPKNAVVFGRYGGADQFDIPFVKDTVTALAKKGNLYFLFMNTTQFCTEKNAIFLDKTTDAIKKRKFINTCDAFLHARSDGETFGLSIGEFAVCKKPIFSSTLCVDDCGSINDAHFRILGDKIIKYESSEDLEQLLLSFYVGKYDMENNGYMQYTPEHVMTIFNNLVINPLPQS